MAETIQLVSNILGRLTGPIFDKELRVLSRRRRTYGLRFGYVMILSLFLVAQVIEASLYSASGGPASVTQVSQMGTMALYAAMTIIWFQFLAGQLLAVVLLSGAIGDEMRKRSLDVLLASPISSVQIVLGKLCSRLLQLVLLLAMGLPMLAVVRAFGGVPWGPVVTATCITLTAMVIVGALSLFLSATSRSSQNVTAGAIAWGMVVWVGIPSVLGLLRWKNLVSEPVAETVSYLSNPFIVMWYETEAVMTPGLGPASGLAFWPLHCVLMLGVSVILLLLAICRVRHAAQIPATGGRAIQQEQQGTSTRWDRLCGRTLRRVRGAPVVWRESKRPVFVRGWRGAVQMILLALAGGGIAALLIYVFMSLHAEFNSVCLVVAGLFEVLFVFGVAASSASAITREKEARALAVLLTIPCNDRTIIWHKAIGILRRHLPLLVPALACGLLAFLTTPGGPGPSTLMSIARFEISLAGSVIFLMGLGFCLSAHLRTTAPAQALTLVLFIVSRTLASLLFSFLLFLGFRRLGGDGVLLWTFIVVVAQAALYSGVGIILGYVAGGALRPRCQ